MESQKLTFYPNSPHSGQPRDMDHILIDGRSSSCLEDVRSLPELTISTHDTLMDGTQPGHRMVIAKLHCRLRKPEPKIKTQTYLRSQCMDKDIQSAIQKELKEIDSFDTYVPLREQDLSDKEKKEALEVWRPQE